MAFLKTLVDIVGAAHVLQGQDCAKYRADWTGLYEADPIAVIRPSTTQEVSSVVKACAAEEIPIVPVSGNTGLTGGTYAKGAVMISMERLNRIREIRADARLAVVDAGVILDQLRGAANAEGLLFPLSFGARGSAMIGGVLSTNAGGSNVLKYGSTRALCLGLEVVLPDGQIMDLMSELHKDNSGYNLKDIMIGAEGTLGLITGAVMKLFPMPRAYATAMVAVPKLDQALGLLNALQSKTGGMVEAFEHMPRSYVARHVDIIEGSKEPFEDLYDVNILVELGATSDRDAQPLADGSVPVVELLQDTLAGMMERDEILDAVVAQNDAQRTEMWKRREDAAEVVLTLRPLQNNDVCLPVDKVSAFLNAMKERLAVLDPDCIEMVVSHLGDGNVHYSLHPTRDRPELLSALMEAVEDEAIRLGGSFSAEHGIGLSKLPSMERRKDAVALSVMRAIKQTLDPKNLLNPGKVLPPA
ncbi:MAG: FAD-binding oxidoreductase [Pseudomonadota bacterium]